jgi:DHA2 family multidrug resistance protein-like MFS transporter
MTETVAPRATRREWIGLAVLVLANVVYIMDLSVLHLAVPKMSAALEPTATQLLWIIDIYGFLVAGALITMGTLGDRIGRRRLLMIGAAAFGLISILAAFSTSAEMLIANRALMGLAGATLAPSTLSLIFNMFRDGKQRAVAIGVWITGFSAGGAIGPVAGGVLLERFWWGSVFLIALPVMALLLILGPRVLPEYKNPDAGRIDLVSAGMSLVAILAVIYGLKQGTIHGFGGVPAASIILGIVVGTLFVRRQKTLADPFIDPELFRHARFSAALSTNLISIFIAFGYFLFVAQYLQLVLDLSPLEAGLWTLPSAAGFIVGANVAPRFIHRVRPAALLGGALAVAAIGLTLLTQVGTSNGSLTLVVIASVIISLALSPVFNLTTEMIVGSAPPERAGMASGISETGAELGAALGIAVLGSIGTAVYRSDVSSNLPSDMPASAVDAALDTLGGATAAADRLGDGLGNILVETSRTAFAHGLNITAAIAAAIALLAAGVVAVVLRNVPAGAVAPEDPHDAIGVAAAD